MEKFEESPSEWEREEGIQNRVDARVGVSQHVAADLDKKMAIILPTGQWYAPSAVIDDAWYCMVWHGIAW